MSDKWVEWDERESVWERCYYSLYNKGYGLEMQLRRAYCFLTGHGDIFSAHYREYWDCEPNYCQRCFADYPEGSVTVPTLLNRVYRWLVRKNWRFGMRLLEKGFNKYRFWLYSLKGRAKGEQ